MGFELITSLFNNTFAVSAFSSLVTLFGTAVINKIFLRGNTKSEEFAKLQVGKFQEVANDLIESKQISLTEYYNMSNFAEIAKIADKINKTKEVDKSKVDKYDFDWFVRFYENVGSITNEDMRLLWAKILSDEIENPGTVSYRTMDVLKSMDKNSAELFNKICRCSINLNADKYLPNYNEYLKSCSITLDNVLKLGEYGLINSTPLLHEEIKFEKEGKVGIIGNDKVLLLKSSGEYKRVLFGVYPFTGIGLYLIGIQDNFSSEANMEVLRNCLYNNNPNVDYSLHKIKKHLENGIEYDECDILQTSEEQ